MKWNPEIFVFQSILSNNSFSSTDRVASIFYRALAKIFVPLRNICEKNCERVP